MKIFTRSSHFYALFHFIWINIVVLVHSFWIESLTLECLRKAIGSILYYLDDSISFSIILFSKTRSIVRVSGYFGAIKIIIFFISHNGLNSYLILLCFLQEIFFLNKVHFLINFQTTNDQIKLVLSLSNVLFSYSKTLLLKELLYIYWFGYLLIFKSKILCTESYQICIKQF